jgi:hypothetical protein
MTFAERVEQELRNPDADVRAALREVDQIGYHAPPVAVPEPGEPAPCFCCPPGSVPTLMGGNSVWRAPPPLHDPHAQLHDPNARDHDIRTVAPSMAAAQLAALSTALGSYANGLERPVGRPWYWPCVAAPLHGYNVLDYILRDEFGGARVTIAWLQAHRHDIVPAIRRLNGRDGE